MMGLPPFGASLIRLGSALFGGPRRSLAILTFHRVLAQADPLLPGEPDAETFSARMDLVGAHFRVLALPEAIQRLRNGTLPSRALCITFDDGYANNCDVALPILLAMGIPATLFIATGYLNGGRMFNDTIIESVRCAPPDFDLRPVGFDRYHLRSDAERRALLEQLIGKLKHLEPESRLRASDAIRDCAGLAQKSDLMMSDSQVRQLSQSGMEIGAHTVTHPILTRMAVETARQEMATSKAVLEQITGKPVRLFAYPNGRPGEDYDATHVALARDVGFDAALSTAWGAADSSSDLFQVPRIAPWDDSALRYGMRIARSYGQRKFRKT